MQRHYCRAERNWLDFEGECSWCGMTEEHARVVAEVTSDAEFRAVMERLRRLRRDDITDD